MNVLYSLFQVSDFGRMCQQRQYFTADPGRRHELTPAHARFVNIDWTPVEYERELNVSESSE